MNGLFVNISGLTHETSITLWEEDEDDDSVIWRVDFAGEHVYVEGKVDDDIWTIIGKAVEAYEAE